MFIKNFSNVEIVIGEYYKKLLDDKSTLVV